MTQGLTSLHNPPVQTRRQGHDTSVLLGGGPVLNGKEIHPVRVGDQFHVKRYPSCLVVSNKTTHVLCQKAVVRGGILRRVQTRLMNHFLVGRRWWGSEPTLARVMLKALINEPTSLPFPHPHSTQPSLSLSPWLCSNGALLEVSVWWVFFCTH